MDLLELLAPDRIVELSSTAKEDVLREIVAVAARSDAVEDPAALEKAVIDREAILSTGIGLGVAIPHAKISSVERFLAAVGISREGIDYDSMDDQPVRIVLLIAGPEGDNQSYLRILSRFTRVVRSQENRDRLIEAAIPDGVLSVFAEEHT